MDVTISVTPFRTVVPRWPGSGQLNAIGGQLEMNWPEAVRLRLDDPEPPPRVVPIGLQALPWAVANAADAWRLVLPIPPHQAPQLVLAAEPPRERLWEVVKAQLIWRGRGCRPH